MLAAFLGVQPKPGRTAPEAPPPLPAAASGAGVAPPPAQKLAQKLVQKLVQKPAQKSVPDRPEPDAPVPPHPVGSASAPDSAPAAQSKPVADAAAGKNDPVAATDTPHVAAAPASPVVTASVTPVRSHVKSGGRANPAATRRPAVQKADPQIRSVQLGLLAAGVYHGTVTGKDNAATTVAIQHYQEKLGHQPTGHLTPDEQKALTGG
nr:peptidoglycan-binding protein [Acidomonas methanolica]